MIAPGDMTVIDEADALLISTDMPLGSDRAVGGTSTLTPADPAATPTQRMTATRPDPFVTPPVVWLTAKCTHAGLTLGAGHGVSTRLIPVWIVVKNPVRTSTCTPLTGLLSKSTTFTTFGSNPIYASTPCTATGVLPLLLTDTFTWVVKMPPTTGAPDVMSVTTIEV